jgi:hypothetical protein
MAIGDCRGLGEIDPGMSRAAFGANVAVSFFQVCGDLTFVVGGVRASRGDFKELTAFG